MNYKINEVTGLKEVGFTGRLLSVSEKSFTNKNGTEYHVGTVEFENEGGILCRVITTIYKKSLEKGMTVGNSYYTIASLGEDGRVFVQTSSLVNAEQATADMFNFQELEIKQNVKEAQQLLNA